MTLDVCTLWTCHIQVVKKIIVYCALQKGVLTCPIKIQTVADIDRNKYAKFIFFGFTVITTECDKPKMGG